VRALTLTQPWASLVILGIKRVETRSWPTRYTGRLAIHAAKGWTRDDRDFAASLAFRGILPAVVTMPRGAVLGTVWLLGTVESNGYPGETPLPLTAFSSNRGYGVYSLPDVEYELGDFTRGRHLWLFDADVERFAEPVPARGALGLWEWQT
jgi:hypothetical protein